MASKRNLEDKNEPIAKKPKILESKIHKACIKGQTKKVLKLYTTQSQIKTTSSSSEAEEDNLLSEQFSKECSLSPPPPVAVISPANSQQEHFEEISRDSLMMFHDLEKWKLVHYSRVANWILERVKSEAQYSEERWNCVVGETGDFQFCVSPDKIFEISFGHVTVLIFKTNV